MVVSSARPLGLCSHTVAKEEAIRTARQSGRKAIPQVTLDLEGEWSSAFEIEELTFNPFISWAPRGRRRNVDTWMEISLRRVDAGDDDLLVPSVRLSFTGFGNQAPQPTCQAITSHRDDPSDLNFLMYSDIWYSFVRQNDEDEEFMETGYNRPIRVLYSCNLGTDCRSLATENWITGGYPAFRRGKYHLPAERLFRKVQVFHGELLHSQKCNWKTDKLPIQPTGKIDILVPTSTDMFAPVPFECPDHPIRARFAFRRYPWKFDKEAPSHMFEIGYGGTAEVTRIDDRSFSLNPQFFAMRDSKPTSATLGKHEALRFWTRWQSSAPLFWDDSRNRIRFEQVLDFRPKVYLFNAFFHIPVDLGALPGGPTELKSYQSPPRLFFVWQGLMPEQCLEFSDLLKGQDRRIRFSNAFEDMKVEKRRLIRVFVLGVLMNLSFTTYISAIFATTPPSNIVWMVRSKLCFAILTLLFAFGIIQETRGREVRPLPLFLACLGLMGAVQLLSQRLLLALSALCVAGVALTFAFDATRIWSVFVGLSRAIWSRVSKGLTKRRLMRTFSERKNE